MSLFRYDGPLTGMRPEERRAVFERGREDLRKATEAVTSIRDAVRTSGDAALRELTLRFDRVDAGAIRVAPEAIEAAWGRTPAPLQAALEEAASNIRTFHEHQLPKDEEVDVGEGVRAGRRIVPLARVGCYVPGGRAAYPSTVLMTVVPAKVAGVLEVVVATPPPVADVTLAAAKVAGADRVVAVGGAQAIFALAYGTESVPRVDKIVGPGNVYVTAAKALAATEVAVDAPAGPSEVFVVADGSTDPELAALDLVAQAEHDPNAACVLASPDAAFLAGVRAHVATQAASTPRGEIVRAALRARGALLHTTDLESACEAAEEYAPEHLVLAVAEPRMALGWVTTYGSAFLGPWSGVALGDYASGPNHVLPTSGLARGRAGLSVDDFVRKPTHQEVTGEGVRRLARTVETLAKAEGLDAHAESVAARRRRLGSP